MTLNAPTPEGIELGSHLARFADAEIAKLRAVNPAQRERCSTCAFRAGTWPNGCAVTLMNALKCIHEGEEPFYCHERDGQECMGYMALRRGDDAPKVKLPWDFVDGALSPLELEALPTP